MNWMNQFQQIFGANLGPNAMYMGQRPMVPQVFRRQYHAYSPAYWNSENRDKLEKGDKIVMPASALEELSRMQVQFPIMFEIAHMSDILPKKSHCSVMEFTAPEGTVYLPIWMIDNLGLDTQGESVVELTTVLLPKGNFVQFQAHETKFAMINNPRVVLEKNLRSYSCLTVGDTIQIEFANHIYKLDVTEVKPSLPRSAATPPAISIIETDIKVDFIEPRDYKEWEKQNKNSNFNFNESNQASGSGSGGGGDSKQDEEEEDDFGVVVDPLQNAKSSKSTYFQSLEQSGVAGQTIKNKKKKQQTSLPSSPPQSANANNAYASSVAAAAANPYSSRGAPLGKAKSQPMVSGGGKCEYHKPEFINGNMSMGSKLMKQRSVRKEEEVVGTMRYIYEVDEHGNRSLVRRLPVRNIGASITGQGHSLK
mmetsp:Transcript_55543/g.92343  ORF Transcript_55543/g.92343 Transcript_55543/m.92343 type:complete len:422 (+) Transcript_55543:143-1408(+)